MPRWQSYLARRILTPRSINSSRLRSYINAESQRRPRCQTCDLLIVARHHATRLGPRQWIKVTRLTETTQHLSYEPDPPWLQRRLSPYHYLCDQFYTPTLKSMYEPSLPTSTLQRNFRLLRCSDWTKYYYQSADVLGLFIASMPTKHLLSKYSVTSYNCSRIKRFRVPVPTNQARPF